MRTKPWSIITEALMTWIVTLKCLSYMKDGLRYILKMRLKAARSPCQPLGDTVAHYIP